MPQEGKSVTVHAVPDDFAALIVGREEVIIRSNTFKGFFDEQIEKRFIFPCPPVPNRNATLIAGLN